MRVLITGSSGQIGTNLALRLLREGHQVFGVDKRLNGWTDDFRYLLQDLSGHYAAMQGGIGGVEYPAADVVVHLAAHAKVHQLVREPARALENMTMTFNVLEYCRQTQTPIIFSSSREVYGDVHRFQTEEGTADFAYAESTYSASKIAGEALDLLLRALLPAAVHRVPLLQRLRPVRQRPRADDPRDPALHPPDPARRADHGVRWRRQGARLHLRRRLCRGDRPGHHRPDRGERPQRDDQPRLRAGKHARPRGRADRRGNGQGARRDARAARCSAR